MILENVQFYIYKATHKKHLGIYNASIWQKKEEEKKKT